jgi:predicted DNA-binding transcriptional regulator YafY
MGCVTIHAMKFELISKPGQQRLIALDHSLRSGGYAGRTREQITARLMSQGFEVSLRTFNRDIQKLRELGAPVGNEYRRGGEGMTAVRWFYTDPSWTMSEIPMTEGTLFALLVSQRVMEQYAGLPLAEELKNAFNTIADVFNRRIAVQHDTLVPISFSREKAEAIRPAVWSEVARATMKHRHLKISYTKGWRNESGEISTRKVIPYHIVNLTDTWYLLASASLENPELRQYSLARMVAAKMLKQHGHPPAEFDINRILDHTFGRFIGDPGSVEEIHVVFDRRVAPLINSRQFSALEKRTVLENGDIELRFPASPAGHWPYYHITCWILSWGADIRVVGPEPLKKTVQEEIAKMAVAANSRD